MKPLQPATLITPPFTKWAATVMKSTGCTVTEAKRMYDEELLAGETWMNDQYVVIHKRLAEGWEHLSIRRADRKPCRDWRDFQAIKNQLCGEEREAVELYPADSRVVDTANQFHLWVLPANALMPCGWLKGSKIDHHESPIPGAVQRPFSL